MVDVASKKKELGLECMTDKEIIKLAIRDAEDIKQMLKKQRKISSLDLNLINTLDDAEGVLLKTLIGG